jgi:hypothetical protein
MGTRVSGRKTAGLKPELGIFGVSIAFVSRGALKPRLVLITLPQDSPLAGHRGVASTLAKALDRFRWKRNRQDVKDFCERCVVCRRAKIQPQIVATFYPLHAPPSPWHTIGLDYLTYFRVSNGFDNDDCSRLCDWNGPFLAV